MDQNIGVQFITQVRMITFIILILIGTEFNQKIHGQNTKYVSI